MENAGRAALATGRWHDARAAFEAALDVGVSAEVLAGLGEALWWLGEFEQSIRYRERAFAAFRQDGWSLAAGTTAIDLSIGYLTTQGNAVAARGWLARAESLARRSEAAALEGWLVLMNGFLSDDPVTAQAHYGRAVEIARESDDVDLELVGLSDLGLSMVRSGRTSVGLPMLDEAMAGTLGGECRRLDTVVWTSCNMLEACSVVGDLDRARQWCRAADAFIERYGCPFLNARCRAHYGNVLLARGQWQQADRELQTALQLAERAGAKPRQEALAALGRLRLRQGRLEEADAYCALVDDYALFAPLAVEIGLARGSSAAASELLGRLLAVLDDSHVDSARARCLLVEAHLAQGDVEAARDAIGTVSAPSAAAGHAAMARALVAQALGHQRTAESLLREALTVFCEQELPWEAARVRVRLSWLLAPVMPNVALKQAQAAHQSFLTLGARRDADEAAALLRSLGGAVPVGSRSDDALSRRELDVLRLLAQGMSNPQIAERLFISRKTAAHHVSNILSKLGVRNRAEAVAYATVHPERLRETSS